MSEQGAAAVGNPLPPVPDPTVLTTQQLDRAVQAQRDYLNSQFAIRDERLKAMDLATTVLHDTITRVPTDLQEAVGHLRELTDLQFTSIDKQLKIRDENAERKIRDDKVALEAAFKAQQDAATEQNKSNTLAIDKSEKSTKENADGLRNQIEEVKNRLNRIEQNYTGIVQNKAGGAATQASMIAIVTLVVLVVGLVVTIVATR